jgi:energy-converting hydrogenase Eha subunit F
MSPIDNWKETGAVFTGGPDSALTIIFVILAVALFVGFLVKMMIHENHAYRQIIEHRPVEKGPVVEGEPSSF